MLWLACCGLVRLDGDVVVFSPAFPPSHHEEEKRQGRIYERVNYVRSESKLRVFPGKGDLLRIRIPTPFFSFLGKGKSRTSNIALILVLHYTCSCRGNNEGVLFQIKNVALQGVIFPNSIFYLALAFPLFLYLNKEHLQKSLILGVKFLLFSSFPEE